LRARAVFNSNFHGIVRSQRLYMHMISLQ
jgi:hypothetical protein